eukprot:Nitzschia sp. Nitz4//scaffold65_size103378//27981//30389//NITZ4_004459-RA/size103378-processed-gene-0.25-mRNA-1//1//CDS//3329556219//1589//frame0
MTQSMSSTVLANPHSTGPAASRAWAGIQAVNQRVLRHFDALPGRYASIQHPPSFATPAQCHPGYDILYTSGTTQGLQVIAERFPWMLLSSSSSNTCLQCHQRRPSSIFLYARNAHNSVVGMRNVAKAKGARFVCRTWKELEAMTPQDFDELCLSQPPATVGGSGDNDNNSDNDDIAWCTCPNAPTPCHLLAFPAECNFGGTVVNVPSIVQTARKSAGNWYCLVDIAKAASTGPVSLRSMDADFAVLSFYKLIGSPTGLGALLVKQSACKILLARQGGETSTNKVKSFPFYQGGGSVDIMLPSRDVCVPRSQGLASLRNGTQHFRGIVSLEHGLDELERRGGMHRIHEHSCSLARELTHRLESLEHGNGRRVVVLSGAWANPALRATAGPTVVFNVVRADGSFVGYNEVSKLAGLYHVPIQFRTGCFCNPGACQEALQASEDQALAQYETAGHVCGDHIDLVDGKPTGAIRISFGKDSLWEDMDTLIVFLERTFVNGNASVQSPKSTSSTGPTTVTLSEMYLYPIKSCGGQSVQEWKLDMPSGKLVHDRVFALVDTTGTAIRLQSCPKMTTIEPKIDLERNIMTVSAPGKEDLIIHLMDNSPLHCGENAVQVCGNRCGGQLWGDHRVSEWFSSYLGIQCWLAKFVNGSYKGPNNQTVAVRKKGFANEEALLLISENAVSMLNQVLLHRNQKMVGSRHFRPNLVVKGIEGDHHIEDQWKTVTIRSSGFSFETKGKCARCAMVDFDPYNGSKGKTLQALAQYRRHKGQITFGIFLCAARGIGATDTFYEKEEDIWIQVGQPVDCI